MTRTVSATISTAVGEKTTRPVYLIYMAWDIASPDVNRYVATYDQSITWNSLTWQSSGIEVTRLTPAGGTLRLPNGDADPWLGLIVSDDPLERAIEIYEYQTDFTVSPHASDATLLFSGQMDASTIAPDGITIDFIEGLTTKVFPATSIDPLVYTHLLASGTRVYWGPDIVLID